MLVIAMAAAATLTMNSRPDGGRLRPIVQCFAITRDDVQIGATYQAIKAIRVAGRKAWDVVVHQRLASGSFDLRDHFVLDGGSLLPISFDSQKLGTEHVRLTYGNGRVQGTRTEKGERTAIDLPVQGPVWEGNLWGVTFGALPLAEGRSFTLPFYQYDQGFGAFTVRVTGTDSLQMPSGARSVWTVDAGVDAKRRVTYLLDRKTGTELGTRGGGFGTRPGGDCTGLS